MTIQLSVTVWTVICFVLLMLILHFLLFKPVLEMLDKRREKINQAAAKKADYEAKTKEYESMLIEKKAEMQSARLRQVKDRLEAIRADSKKALEVAKEERLAEVDNYRLEAEKMHAELLETLSVHKAELAAAFADRVIKE